MQVTKKNNFTIIHILAAFMVLVGHQFVLMGQPVLTIFGIDMHGLGVRILFMVSGYLVSASYLRSNNAIHFLWKRISRLYPPLIVCLILTVFVLRFVSDTPEYYWNSALLYFLHNLEMRPKFDLAGVFTSNPYPVGVNGSLWTLPIELACYLILVPLIELFKFLKEKSSLASGGVIVILLLGLSSVDLWKVLYGGEISIVVWDTDWINMLSLGIYFLIGVSAQLLQLKRIFNMQYGVLVVLLYSIMPSKVKYFITPYVISYIVLSFALVEEPLFYDRIKKDICYGLYLYAFPIQQLLILSLVVNHNMSISPYLMCLISAPVVFLIAVLDYYFIEERIWIKWIKKKCSV